MVKTVKTLEKEKILADNCLNISFRSAASLVPYHRFLWRDPIRINTYNMQQVVCMRQAINVLDVSTFL